MRSVNSIFVALAGAGSLALASGCVEKSHSQANRESSGTVTVRETATAQRSTTASTSAPQPGQPSSAATAQPAQPTQPAQIVIAQPAPEPAAAAPASRRRPQAQPEGEAEANTRGSRARERGTRDETTIFSPLPLPAPNTIRLASGAPGPDYWQQQADYKIEATLNAESNEVTGRETITYTNNAPTSLNYLWIHLEQNIFRADSIGSYISGNTAIGMSEAFGNGCVLKSMRANGKDLEYHVYDTMARIDLEEPLEAGGSKFVFEVEWSFVVPDHAFRRFGVETVEQGKIYEIAQWFPAMAVYDDIDGWNTMGYLGTGEFYTNFGNYDVTITVPRNHLVAATGVLQNPKDVYTGEQLDRLDKARQSDETVMIRSAEEVADPATRPQGDGPLTWHYKAEKVRTFAWASSPAFIYDACGLDGVLVQSVYPKEAVPTWNDSTQMLKVSINGYNKRWFKYPYPVATNVNGPEGGMEYPMIIFCGSRRSERGLYGVTTHEIGHNWFPMTVNSDERRYAWMDEGFNTFINHYSTPEWFKDEDTSRGGRGGSGRRARRNPYAVPIMTYPDQLNGFQLGSTQYDLPARGLILLREQILGEERFDRAFREYIRRWAFKSPQPADFFRTMEDVAGTDLAWFWRGWFYETDSLDQAIMGVDVSEQGQAFNTSIQIDNLDELVMPVALELTFEDGSTQRQQVPVEVWFATNRYTLRFDSPKRVTKVVIDPDGAYPDVDRGNNSWEADKPQEAEPTESQTQ